MTKKVMTDQQRDERKTSNREINKRITSLARRGKKWNMDVHEAICFIARHADQYRDCTGFDRLLNVAMNGTQRRRLVVDTIMEFTPIVITTKSGKFHSKFAEAGSKHDKPFDHEALAMHPWYEHEKVDRDPEIITFEEFDENVIKFAERWERKVSQQRKDGLNIPQDDYDMILGMCQQIKKLARQKVVPLATEEQAAA